MSCFSETGLKVNTKTGYAATGTPDTVGYSYEGFMTPEMRFERRLMFKEYELKDHLGNVRLVFGDATVADAAGETRLDVRALSNYYPFGMLQPHRYYQDAGYTNSRQGFNGIVERSEIPTAFSFHKSIGKKDDDVKADEGQHYDFGARAYDPRVGRWYKLDPKESCYPGFSPYHFAANNPIIVIDQDGEIWKLTFRDGDDSELQAAFESMIRKVFSDKVMAFPANGIVELGFVDEYTIESLSKEQQELYNVLLDVIKDEENTAVTQIVYDDDRYYVGSYQRQPGTGDGWDESIIDVADLEHYSNNDDVLFYAIAVLGHEVIESYYKATEYGVGTSRINGRPFYEWAHSDAIEIEEKIGGYERVGDVEFDGTINEIGKNNWIPVTGTQKQVIQTGGGSAFWAFFGLCDPPEYKTIETHYKDGKIENVTIEEGDTR